MLKFRNVFLILLLATVSLAPLRVHAQDEDSEAMSDTPAIVPSPNGGQSSPPVIMDESDSGGVSEVDEYDN